MSLFRDLSINVNMNVNGVKTMIIYKLFNQFYLYNQYHQQLSHKSIELS